MNLGCNKQTIINKGTKLFAQYQALTIRQDQKHKGGGDTSKNHVAAMDKDIDHHRLCQQLNCYVMFQNNLYVNSILSQETHRPWLYLSTKYSGDEVSHTVISCFDIGAFCLQMVLMLVELKCSPVPLHRQLSFNTKHSAAHTDFQLNQGNASHKIHGKFGGLQQQARVRTRRNPKELGLH